MKLGPAELIILIIPYFVPTIIAIARGKSNAVSIFLLNLLLGWTFVGWVVSLVWACTSNKPKAVVINNHNHVNQSTHKPNPPSSTLDEKLNHIQKLKTLLDSGALSQAEFDAQKAKILNS